MSSPDSGQLGGVMLDLYNLAIQLGYTAYPLTNGGRMMRSPGGTHQVALNPLRQLNADRASSMARKLARGAEPEKLNEVNSRIEAQEMAESVMSAIRSFFEPPAETEPHALSPLEIELSNEKLARQQVEHDLGVAQGRITVLEAEVHDARHRAQQYQEKSRRTDQAEAALLQLRTRLQELVNG